VAEYRLAVPRCACHTYYSVPVIGGWLHGNTADTLAPVTEWGGPGRPVGTGRARA
jgi:hypothetical protein